LVNSSGKIRGVSPEEEKEGYGGKDLQERKVYAWNQRVNEESGIN